EDHRPEGSQRRAAQEPCAGKRNGDWCTQADEEQRNALERRREPARGVTMGGKELVADEKPADGDRTSAAPGEQTASIANELQRTDGPEQEARRPGEGRSQAGQRGQPQALFGQLPERESAEGLADEDLQLPSPEKCFELTKAEHHPDHRREGEDGPDAG